MQFILLVALCGTFASARPALNDGLFGAPPPQPGYFPAGFEELLPEDAKAKLIAAHDDRSLSFDERRDRIESVFDELPREILEKLPLPPGLARLPFDAQEPFRALHVDRSIGWRERQTRVHELIKQLPEEQQRLVHPPAPHFPPMGPRGFGIPPPPFPPAGADFLPPRPPPGFEAVLSPSIFKQLMAVHENLRPTNSTACRLPPNFERLSPETLQRVRKIMQDFSLEWDARHQKVDEFVRSLPREERRLLRPVLPGFEALPEKTRDQIDDLFANRKLHPMERNQKIRDLLISLPEEIRSKIPPPPPVFPFHAPPPPPKALQNEAQNDEFAVKEQQASFV
ncbi:hypothetical protein M3Y99_01218900 [Aphelenchoides fujianensis]|nr:hypothetical protein M3Y99_01218900 [Aphelenchoides fujianensis]